MADLVEASEWTPGIYQLETTDPVEGGPDGIDNLQARQLANRTAYLKAALTALGEGTQPLDATLTALAAIATVADRLIYATGADAFATTTLTAFARTLLDDADAATARATLGVLAGTESASGLLELATSAETVTGTDSVRATHAAGVKAAIDAAITALVNGSPTALNQLNELATALGNDPNFATTITTALASKQPLDATLTALAAMATAANQLIYATGSDTFGITALTAFARTLLDDVDAATARATLGAQATLVANDAGVKTALNASGAAPIYACRAWVNFNGTNTVEIRASGNVSSITDNGTGDYTINFATAMPDANYEINGTVADNNGGGGFLFVAQKSQTTPPTTTAVRIATIYASNNGHYDSSYISISIFR